MKLMSTKHPIGVLSYITGFVLSLALTLVAYMLVSAHVNGGHAVLSHRFIAVAVIILALTQFVAQLVFFLHLGREQRPRWNVYALLFTVLIVFVLVVGSLWIMTHLNYSMQLTPPNQIDQAIIQDEGINPSQRTEHEHHH